MKTALNRSAHTNSTLLKIPSLVGDSSEQVRIQDIIGGGAGVGDELMTILCKGTIVMFAAASGRKVSDTTLTKTEITNYFINLSPGKPHALCLGEHVKMSVPDIITVLVMIVFKTPYRQWAGVEGLRVKPISMK
ncbi:hypothetical protein EVAR_20620_1 [Eumeta japonica]|uniref:Uncharacterized protein n=1 Tax=Eumeta variegata TaxID=151549 RepID=A0A4C1VBW8_EUMVA|nr:hypothetical protein EVAR_20620_1 [Eumeta japonica]